MNIDTVTQALIQEALDQPEDLTDSDLQAQEDLVAGGFSTFEETPQYDNDGNPMWE